MARFPKTLIVEQNNAYMRQVKQMLDGLCGEVAHCYDGVTAMRLYDRMKPDLLLVEAILPRQDGFAVLEHVLDDTAVKIMLTAVNHDMIVRKAFELKADYLFVKPYEKESFIARLLEVADYKQSAGGLNVGIPDYHQLKKEISDLLKTMGIPVNIKGFELLRDCMVMLCVDPALRAEPYSELYQRLAERHGTSSKCVERNIRHAIEISSIRGDQDAYLKYFRYTVDSEKGKPTNKEFIAALVDAFPNQTGRK